METYENLLDEAYKEIKPIKKDAERFEIPKIEGHIEGSKTVLTNLRQIADYLRRNFEHLLKFLLHLLRIAP